MNSKVEVMGVEAILSEKDGKIRVALPAFCVGKKDKPGIYFWAGELQNGQVISVSAESARQYLNQLATTLPKP